MKFGVLKTSIKIFFFFFLFHFSMYRKNITLGKMRYLTFFCIFCYPPNTLFTLFPSKWLQFQFEKWNLIFLQKKKKRKRSSEKLEENRERGKEFRGVEIDSRWSLELLPAPLRPFWLASHRPPPGIYLFPCGSNACLSCFSMWL